ncbi:MAG TPA: hypothetical protein VK850_08565 [Candidatus Binatia bacterium]|nr:hypothetical protein [Candidatus Binatia bacterium]
MKLLKLPLKSLWCAAFCFGVGEAAFAQIPVFISEILFNPPGTDIPNEYIELRGLPGYTLPEGVFFVAVDGDRTADSKPGSIVNVFDLSGRKFSTNGYMLLLQKGNLYAANPSAATFVNTGSGTGFGSGSSSSIGHRGAGGKTDLDNASVTFFLIHTRFAPEPKDTIDANDDGVPDGPYLNWTVIDSIGVLDDSGSESAYGAINYRRNTPPGNGSSALGVVVSVGFTPTYFGRSGNTTGSTREDWVACDNLTGTAPNWTLPTAANTVEPPSFAGALNHIGSRNFGALQLRGLIITPSGGSTAVVEGGGTDSYMVGLNSTPTANANVLVQVTAPPGIQVSTDGANFFANRTLTFNNITPRTITLRALDDNMIDGAAYVRTIAHDITSTGDSTLFPLGLRLAGTPVQVTENDFLLLNEIKVNPPGTADAPHEFVEIRGPPGALLTNVQFLALEGDAGGDPGTAEFVINLSNQQLGANGLLLLTAPGSGYGIPPATTVVNVPAFGTAGGVLGNGSASFLLIAARGDIPIGADLDHGDNGILEGLPVGTTILDAVGWRDGNTNDLIYGGVMLVDGDTPDAAARLPDNNNPSSAAAWFFGDLSGTNGSALVFDPQDVSSNSPAGASLSPGDANVSGAYFTLIQPLAGAIGDPTNPKVFFAVGGFSGAVTITVTSDNQAVVPDSNLLLTPLGNSQYSLALNPVGVGYSLINLGATDGSVTAHTAFPYAASEQGNPSTRYHMWVTDASTAIPIDSDYMFVGDDENQVLRIYRRKESGPPVAGFDMTPFLGLTDIEGGKPREVDIEASTRVGNRIFWMGAHSHANVAEQRTNRSRIFSTDISGSGAASTLSYVGRYDFLKLDLVNWDVNNGHGKGANYYGLAASTTEGVLPKALDGSGFNIEGLTMAPFDANVAYVGFRAPLVPTNGRTHALIVPVLNFAALAASPAAPAGTAIFGAPIELDLFNRGIRSIECIGANYLIVAGIPGDFSGPYPKDFKLFTWTGNPADAPQERAADLRGMNPEGIIELPQPPWGPASLVHLVSDNGRKFWYGDNIQGKDLPVRNFKKFRSDIVTLGAVVKSMPYIVSVKYLGGNVTIVWRGIVGERYRVWYKLAFSDPLWTVLPGDITATTPYCSKTDLDLQGRQRFYKVEVLQ